MVLKGLQVPLSAVKVLRAVRRELPFLDEYEVRGQVLLSKDGVLRNACAIAHNQHEVYLCLVNEIGKRAIDVDIVGHVRPPYAMFECKRVGIEEGTKKGPQTIEKAKQGAYVARACGICSSENPDIRR